MTAGQKQNLEMIPSKTLENMDKNLSSRLALFGH